MRHDEPAGNLRKAGEQGKDYHVGMVRDGRARGAV